MFLLFLLSLVTVLILIYFSNRSDNKIFRWIGAIIPPFFMLSFIFIPIDLITSIAWLLAGLIAIYSGLHIIKDVFLFIYTRLKNKEANTKEIAFRVIRPSLYLLILFSSHFIVQMSVASANKAAIDLALNMKEHVLENGVCKDSISGWNKNRKRDSNLTTKRFGEYGTQYRVSYWCDPVLSIFSFQVKINQDEAFSVSYSESGSLQATYGHYARQVEILINDNTDLDALANMRSGS